MKRFFLLILIIPSLLLGQTKDELDLCMAIQGNSFSTNTAAENALNRILNTIGASKNFVLSPCDRINNAVATAYKGTRYILYDKEFMNLINRNTNDWSNLFVLAHEVGHHINGHSIDILLYANDVVDAPSLEKKREQELEADEFAAFVLAKLGATLSQLNNVITLISDNSDDTYSTHPSRDKRIAIIKKGHNKGFETKYNRTNSVDLFIKKYKAKESFVKYGDWYREDINDPFDGKFWTSVTNGKILGESKSIYKAPILKITSKGALEYYPEAKNFNEKKMPLVFLEFDGISNLYQVIKMSFKYSVMNNKNEVIFNGSSHTSYKKGFYEYLYGMSTNEETIIYNLKKGSKFLIKPTSITIMDGNKVNGKDYLNISENLIFEYSLSGSSKALAD